MRERQKTFFVSAIVILALIALFEGAILLRNSFTLMLRNESRWYDWTASVSKTFRALIPLATHTSQTENALTKNEDILLQETAEDLERIKSQINRLFYEMTEDAAFARHNLRAMAPAHDPCFHFENTRIGEASPLASGKPGLAGEAWISRLQSEIGQVFQRAYDSRHDRALNLIEDDWRNVGEVSSVNMVEDGTNYVVAVSISGFEKADINVCLNGRILSIEASREEQRLATEHSLATSAGRFKTQIMLPNDIVGESARASCENSILKITIPKKPASNSLARKVTVM